MQARLLVAVANGLTLAGVREVVGDSDEIRIVGEATTGEQVLPLVRRTDPDLVVVEMHMPDFDGLTMLDLVRRERPRCAVVMLAAPHERERIQVALALGARACIIRAIDRRDFLPALRQALEGNVYYGDPLGSANGDGPPTNGNGATSTSTLNEREVAILERVARGLSNRAIAKELWLSEETVKCYLTRIYRKLSVSNRTQAARYAYDHGLAVGA